MELHGDGVDAASIHSRETRRELGVVLESFHSMLSYFFQYKHLNYAKWGSVFIAEMEQLPAEVLEEFKKGNFVVKWSEGEFNEVSADHSLEWLKGIGKRGGGMVGITKTSSALTR